MTTQKSIKQIKADIKKWMKLQKTSKVPICPNCFREMHQVRDKISGEYTGYNWRCKCMPENMVVSIG